MHTPCAVLCTRPVLSYGHTALPMHAPYAVLPTHPVLSYADTLYCAKRTPYTVLRTRPTSYAHPTACPVLTQRVRVVKKGDGPIVLILAPTRELAQQIQQ
eukprot:3063218-Rhodomonas_salina.2